MEDVAATLPTAYRAIVTDVTVSENGWLPAVECEHEGHDEAGCTVPAYVYVYPSANGRDLGEFRLYRGEITEQWYDDSGLNWPQEARAQLESHLPRVERELPIIITNDIGLKEQRNLAINALQKANDPPVLFRRGGEVTEVKRNEKNIPVAKIVGPTRMRDRLGEVAVWTPGLVTMMGPAGPVMVPSKIVKPPADTAAVLVETPGLILPALDAIVEYPVMGLDGRISTRRGYDRGTATFYSPSTPMGRLPNLDTVEQVDTRVALGALNGMLVDFEFASKADKVNVLALMLTPILRPLIDGPVPLAAVRAAKAGTGKSLLVKAALTVLTGREPEPTSLGSDEDEAEKRMLAVLLAGSQFVFLDNVPTGRVLESAALARALTATTWTQRIIQTSKSPSLPIRCTWVATGNNLTMSDEIARRSYMIELDSKLERPDLRDPSRFAHPDLLGWVREQRSELLLSLLIIARAWADDGGMKITGGPQLSSFEEWSRIVGSVIRFAGLSDFLGNEDRKRDIAEDETNIERAVLLARIQEAMGDCEFTLKELHRATFANADMSYAVQPFLVRARWTDDAAVKELGNAIRTIRDASYGGLKLVKVRDSNAGAVYQIKPW
jgi:putative DNA primase/helicase